MLVPGAAHLASIGQVLPLVETRVGRTEFAVGMGEQPLLYSAGKYLVQRAVNCELKSNFIFEVVTSEFPDASKEKVLASAGEIPDQQEVKMLWAAALARMFSDLSQLPSGILIIDGNELPKLRYRTQRILLSRLRSHMLFSVTNRMVPILARHPYQRLLISSGRSIAMILPTTKQVTDEMREQAREVFDSDRVRRGTGEVQLDNDFDDVAGLG